MSSRLAWLVSLALLLTPWPAAALGSSSGSSPHELLPKGFVSFAIESPHDTGDLGPSQRHFYGGTRASPSWIVAQWNMPGPALSPFLTVPGGFRTHSDEAEVSVRGDVLQISQSGATLPCTHPGGRPLESDLFFAPASGHFTPEYRLSDLAALNQAARVTVSGAVLPDKVCKANMGFALVAIVLVDLQVHPAQTLFYQLELGRVCHAVPGGLNCFLTPRKTFYFSRTNPYGAGEFAPMLGRPYLADGVETRFFADLLPRLRAVIRNGPPGMDRDISHWLVTNAYYGQHIWGGVTLTTRWSGVTLTAVPKSS